MIRTRYQPTHSGFDISLDTSVNDMTHSRKSTVIDFFDLHSKHYEGFSISSRNAMIMYKFLTMLENSFFRSFDMKNFKKTVDCSFVSGIFARFFAEFAGIAEEWP